MVWADANSSNSQLLIGDNNGTNAGRYRSLKFTNGSTTNNADGSISVTTGGGSGTSYWTSTNNVDIYPTVTGNVGIGTPTPLSKFQVNGNSVFNSPNYAQFNNTSTFVAGTGGTITTYFSSGLWYYVHTFTGSGTFVAPNQSVTASDLVVAGGGGGSGVGTTAGGRGGGGAGGVILDASFPLTSLQSIGVTVGTGGSGGASAGNGSPGNNGTDSIFGTDDAVGGGGGGSVVGAEGGPGNGGSGGGTRGDVSLSSGGTGVVGQGNAGGAQTSNNDGGAGGGGCSAVGANTGSNNGSNGGNGCSETISGTTVIYGGGGGGSATSLDGGATAGSGGTGGGGAGAVNANGNNATANTGGGGGAAGSAVAHTGGNGAGGVVVISYPAPMGFNPNASAQVIYANGAISANTTSNSGILTIQGSGSTASSNSISVTNSSGAPVFYTIDSTNVGIGSSNPGQNLDINGTARMTGFTLNSGTSLNNKILTSDASGNGTWQTAASGSGTVDTGTANYATYYPASTAEVAANAGIQFSGTNVGINKTPAQNLDINGTVIINGNLGIGSTIPGDLVDVAGTVNHLFVGINGNVGIGTFTSGANNPISPLDIPIANAITIGTTGQQGNIKIRRSADGSTSALIGYTASSALALQESSGGGSTTVSQNGAGSVFLDTAGVHRVIVLTGGNVGIGTSNPGQNLDIFGTLRISGGAAQITNNTANTSQSAISVVDNSLTSGQAFSATSNNNSFTGQLYNASVQGSSATGNAALFSNSGTGTDVKITNTGTGAALTTTGGNVGIGSLNPGALFDVFGTVRLSGTGHIISVGASPTIANNDCGTTSQGTVNSGSTDMKGSVVAGTLNVTSCAMTFAGVFTVAPICITQDDTNILGIKTTTTTTKMTIASTTSMSNDTVTYVCVE